MQDIMELRKSYKGGVKIEDTAYYWYCNNILELVAGKRKWKVEKHKVEISCVERSDEAFGLVVLEC